MKKFSWLRRNSLSQQLLLSCGLSLATVGLCTLSINYFLIQSDLEKQVQARAQSITQSVEFATEGLLEQEQRPLLRRVIQNYSVLPAVVDIAIVNPEGLILADSQGSSEQAEYAAKHPELKALVSNAANHGKASSYEMTLDQKPVLVQILPFSSVLFGTSGRRGLAIAILDLKQIQQEISRTFLASTLTLMVGIIIILIFIWVLIRRSVLTPLNSLNKAVTDSKETGNFVMPSQMPVNEIHFLATTFKTVFEQLAYQEQLRAEIAHRQQVETTLRESETRERKKSEQLEKTLVELQQAQLQLVQSEKMSSLGQLVAGVAHEINNPVNFIHGNLNHLEQHTQDLLLLIQTSHQLLGNNPEFQSLADEIEIDFIQEDLPKILGSMKVGTQRIREIVLSLRNFSRLDEAEFKAVDIHEGIDSTLMILQHRLKEQTKHPAIQVVRNYGNLPLIECYAGQVNQVLMNIFSNAIDALEEQANQESILPTITIHTSVIEADQVKIAVADNGCGMPEKVKKQIFNPFFTTKPVGKGTGMGMSISYQIITERHNGKLECLSAPGQGTEFIITLPIQQQQKAT